MTDPTNTSMLALSSIKPGANPRRYFDSTKHAEMVESLKLRGMLQPILVRPDPAEAAGYLIIAGGRRHKAALDAFGADGVVPVRILQLSDSEALEAAIDENDIRDDTSETEQADAAVRVLAACAGDRAEAALRLAWSPSKLARRLALADLADPVKAALDERRIKVGHAELLAAVPADKQVKALDTIVTATLDVGRTRELLMRMTQELATATFDKVECIACPFNSASQRALFETHVDDGHCTNPGCYQLKTEAAQPAVPAPAPPPSAAPPAAEAGPSKAGKPAAPAAPSKPAATTSAPAKPAVTAEAIAKRTSVTAHRDAAWRTALTQAADGDPEFEETFKAVLRGTWQVDAAFLGQFGKEELTFVARECGLIRHMGEKAFAKLLDGKAADLIAGMLNAKGFDWAGHLPSAMTPDGKYSPPPPAAASPQKD